MVRHPKCNGTLDNHSATRQLILKRLNEGKEATNYGRKDHRISGTTMRQDATATGLSTNQLNNNTPQADNERQTLSNNQKRQLDEQRITQMDLGVAYLQLAEPTPRQYIDYLDDRIIVSSPPSTATAKTTRFLNVHQSNIGRVALKQNQAITLT